MAHKYFHVGIHFGLGVNVTNLLEPTFRSIADDWIRYAPNCWIVWTPYSLTQCSATLRAVLTLNDQFVILEVDPLKRDGMHYEWVWSWLNEPRYEGFRVPGPNFPESHMVLPPRLPGKT